MRNRVSWVAVFCGLSSMVYACSGSGKGADTPLEVASQSSKEADKSGEPQAAAPSEGTPKSEAASETSSSTPAAPSGDTAIRKASRPPLELLGASDVVFILNFPESEAGIRAKTECEQQFSADPQASRACISKARSKIAIEFVRFEKDGGGQWWWTTYNKYQGNLLKWHKIQFLPGEETAESIVLKPIGKDKGVAPMARVPRSVKIEFPNDYSITVNDPEYGKLVLDAKIGLLGSD